MHLSQKKKLYFDYKKQFQQQFPDLGEEKIEKLIENIMCTNILKDFESILDWYDISVKQNTNTVTEIELSNLKNWELNKKNIRHSTGKFFEIIGISTHGAEDRESGAGWDQPFVREVNQEGGLLGLIKTHINELPHYLVQAKFEPGNYGKLQISPTLQATFSNINKDHGGRSPYFIEFFADWETESSNYIFNSWLAEDGGRFYKKRNRGLVKFVDYSKIQLVDEKFTWVSLDQVKKLLTFDAIINPHLARLIFF